MRRTRVVASALILAPLFAATSARAQTAQPGFNLDKFEPSESTNEWFAADTLDLRGKVRPSVSLVLDGQYRPLVAYASDGSVVSAPVADVFTAHVGASIALWERLRVGVNVPVVLYQDGDATRLGTGSVSAPSSAQAVGDVRLGADVRLLGEYRSKFSAAIGGQLWLPSGDAASYSSDGNVRGMPRLTAAGDLGPIAYSARVGVLFGRPERYFASTKLGQEFTFAAAVGLRAVDGKLVVGPELFGSTLVISSPSAGNSVGLPDSSVGQTAIEGLFGAHYSIGDVRVGAGAGAGLTRGLGAPTFRGLLGVEWAPAVQRDVDGDGILDDNDACPKEPGVATSDPATNGCPSDRDHDGVLDRDDACVDVAGVHTSDPKTNGCPPDRDHDGVLDREDACVDVAGVRTSDPKTNGCPPDRDHDGVLDSKDACVDVPGVATDDPKTNGCPPDRDHDGIPDAQDACVDVPGQASPKPEFNGCPADIDADAIANDADACPREPGKPNPDATKNGCPTAFVSGGVIKILDQVKFKTASAEILPGKDSQEVLDAVLAVLKDHPELKKVAVEGHTDNRGDAGMNKRLSAARAASVVKWMTSHGIEAARLSSAGFGQERPIADNGTDDGRRQNRRVEFHIVGDDGSTSTTVSSPSKP